MAYAAETHDGTDQRCEHGSPEAQPDGHEEPLEQHTRDPGACFEIVANKVLRKGTPFPGVADVCGDPMPDVHRRP